MPKEKSSFRTRVLTIVRAIPKGKTLSYGEVAARAGSPRAFRAVGTILKANYDPRIPCHRVVLANGKLGSYNRGAKKKRALLIQEGAISPNPSSRRRIRPLTDSS